MADNVKGVDDKYCSTCGEVIKMAAEICPKCGVRQTVVQVPPPPQGIYGAGPAITARKDKTTAGLLAILLEGIGIHKFYLGFTVPGLVYLLVNTIGLAITWMLLFIPNIALGVMAIIEGIIYLTKTDVEFEQLYVIQKRQWF